MKNWLIGIVLLLFSCDALTEDDDSGKEKFKSMYNDEKHIILMPLYEGYKWTYLETNFDVNGKMLSEDTVVIEINSKEKISGKNVYFYDDDEGFIFTNDRIYLSAEINSGSIDYGDEVFWVSTDLRDAHDQHNGTAVYTEGDYSYELTGVVDQHQIVVNGSLLFPTGPTYTRSGTDEYAEYKFADWSSVVDTFFGLVEINRYTDDTKNTPTSTLTLIKFEHPDFK